MARQTILKYEARCTLEIINHTGIFLYDLMTLLTGKSNHPVHLLTSKNSRRLNYCLTELKMRFCPPLCHCATVMRIMPDEVSAMCSKTTKTGSLPLAHRTMHISVVVVIDGIWMHFFRILHGPKMCITSHTTQPNRNAKGRNLLALIPFSLSFGGRMQPRARQTDPMQRSAIAVVNNNIQRR